MNPSATQAHDDDNARLVDAALERSGQACSARNRNLVLRMLNLNEADLVAGLRTCAALSGGRYPSRLDHETVRQEVLAWLRERYGADAQVEEAERTRLEGDVLDTFFMASYYGELIREKRELAYYGRAVTAEDADAVLVRWRQSRDQYTVVFGDLRTETVTAEHLAVLESPRLE